MGLCCGLWDCCAVGYGVVVLWDCGIAVLWAMGLLFCGLWGCSAVGCGVVVLWAVGLLCCGLWGCCAMGCDAHRYCCTVAQCSVHDADNPQCLRGREPLSALIKLISAREGGAPGCSNDVSQQNAKCTVDVTSDLKICQPSSYPLILISGRRTGGGLPVALPVTRHVTL
jgi:hypothetical protein